MEEGWGSPVARVDRGRNLVQRLAALEVPISQTCLSLANLAHPGHSLALVAAEQRVEAFPRRAAAVAPDAVHDLGNLADILKRREGVGMVLDLVVGQHLGR